MEGIDGQMFWMGVSLRIAVGVCLGVIGAWLIRGAVRLVFASIKWLAYRIEGLLRGY